MVVHKVIYPFKLHQKSYEIFVFSELFDRYILDSFLCLSLQHCFRFSQKTFEMNFYFQSTTRIMTSCAITHAALGLLSDDQIQENLRQMQETIADAPGNSGAVKIIEKYYRD